MLVLVLHDLCQMKFALNPTILLWGILKNACGSLQTRDLHATDQVRKSSIRSDIFVETRIDKISNPGGVTDSEKDSARFENVSPAEDVAPDGAWKFFLSGFYQDVAPTALVGSQPDSSMKLGLAICAMIGARGKPAQTFSKADRINRINRI